MLLVASIETGNDIRGIRKLSITISWVRIIENLTPNNAKEEPFLSVEYICVYQYIIIIYKLCPVDDH